LLGLQRLRCDERFGPWLVGIGLNVSRRLLEPRARPVVALDASAELVAPGPGPHELAESAFSAVRMREAIAELPAGQRDAVTLFYLAGLSQAEVAEHLGTAVGAVKTRLHKARACLQDRLSDLQKEPTPVPTVSMRVADVRDTGRDEILSSHVIFLEEEGGSRSLPIWVGAAEATTLALRLRDVELPRPGTYELAGDLLRAADAQLREVRIVALTESVFYAEVVLGDGSTVDARPSDALNLALVVGAPVLVDEAVLERAASTEAAPSDMLAEALQSRRDADAIVDEVSRARLADQARRADG
jgi:RNA polymerase sigma factor (sigma-70 family)